MPPIITTIIPVYNRALYLVEALESVLSQTHRPIEVILVDDGSTDGTAAAVDELARKHGPVVRAIHQENGGPGAARETGRLVAKGEFIQYLDSDDFLLPGKFDAQVAALKDHPECDIAYGITRLVDSSGKTLQEPYKWTGREIPSLFPGLLVDRWWNTHTPLYRRGLCDRIGPWTTGRMGEDWIQDARAAALGTRLAYVPEPVSAHRQHEEERLTAGETTLPICRDLCRLVTALHQAALQAQVDPECPEMRHFARWAFFQARQAGGFGLAEEAKSCFSIARQLATGIDVKMALIGGMAKILGWSLTGRVCRCLEQTVPHSPGASTLPKSYES